MLLSLHITNVALIDELHVNFQPGFNVLSGETGAGKSVILSSLIFLLGGRSTVDLVRAGTSRCIVEGVFNVRNNKPLLDLLADAGVEVDDYIFSIKRELELSGRGRVFVDGRPSTLGLLKRFRPYLIDIHGQSDQQSLLDPVAQLAAFDEFAGALELKKAVGRTCDEILQTVKTLKATDQSDQERVRALDFIEFQIHEIEQSRIVADDEDAKLDAERRVLLNAEKLATLASEAYASIAGDEDSITSRLAALQRKIRELAALDISFEAYLEQFEETKLRLEDLTYFLTSYQDAVQASPELLISVDNRLQELARLKHKYGGTLKAVIETLNNLLRRRDELVDGETQAENFRQEMERLIADYGLQAARLKEARLTKVAEFEERVKQEFAAVSTHAPHFSVAFLPPPDNLTKEIGGLGRDNQGIFYSREGTERIEFRFSANPGEPLRSLSDSASGGELSRLMLAIKTVLSPTRLPRTLVFDEIDSGVGGEIADAVGRRLKRLALNNQVLCVTHQVQLAKYADAHFLVRKEGNGRMNTRVKQLSLQERVEEMARMIAGERITETARKHAQEMLSRT